MELLLEAREDIGDPYTDVEVWADFTHETGDMLRRPAFWDGGRTWRIRFASPLHTGTWTWVSGASQPVTGLVGVRGGVRLRSATQSGHRFYDHGFWRMSAGGRSLVHADGTPALLVADTAWALPWRATTEQVETYAGDRQSKGFNAVLLMSVQPDMLARGPRNRSADEGFDRPTLPNRRNHAVSVASLGAQGARSHGADQYRVVCSAGSVEPCDGCAAGG